MRHAGVIKKIKLVAYALLQPRNVSIVYFMDNETSGVRHEEDGQKLSFFFFFFLGRGSQPEKAANCVP